MKGKDFLWGKILHSGEYQVTNQLQWDCVLWIDLGIEGDVNF